MGCGSRACLFVISGEAGDGDHECACFSLLSDSDVRVLREMWRRIERVEDELGDLWHRDDD